MYNCVGGYYVGNEKCPRLLITGRLDYKGMMKDMQNLRGILEMSGSDSQVMKLQSQLRSKLRFSVVPQDRPISAPRARIEPPKPVVPKREIEVKSRVDWLCALRNFDSLISQAKKTPADTGLGRYLRRTKHNSKKCM